MQQCRSRPYKKNDQATIESKNNHLVRKYVFYYRYDTEVERTVLNRCWRLVGRPVQLPDPDEDAGRVRRRPGWQAQTSLRQARQDRP